MRFFHLSDILIGNNFESGMRWEYDRGQEITDSLSNLLDRASEENVGLIMITGGLFAHPPVTGELNQAAALMAGHPETEIVITAGTSDPVSASSPVLSFTWPANVHFVSGQSVRCIRLGRLNTVIYAASCTESRDGSLSCPDTGTFLRTASQDAGDEAIRIVMLPDLENEDIIRDLNYREFSYIAAAGAVRGLNHEIIRNKAMRPGPFEPRDISDRGAHGAMAGEISEESGELKNIEFVPMANASYVTLNIRISEKTSEKELVDAVSDEVRRRKAANIYRLRITGQKDPDLEIDFTKLKNDFRIRDVLDESEPLYDYRELFREHSEDMIGFYISSVYGRRERMTGLEKRAMFYGLEALLKTAGREEA